MEYLDEIRKMINNETTKEKLKSYSQYIPFKYFYIEKINKKFFLRIHFPLVKEIWNNIIMKGTVELFDGEITYNGNVIGSLLELNLIINIKDKKIALDIDSFCEVDTISEFGNLIEKDTDNFSNKNIFITQKNQNGTHFDIAYLHGKNTDSPKLAFIQVKKSYSNNRVDLQQTNQLFKTNENNFLKLFGFIPKEINLIYITLINDKIKQAYIDHEEYKNDTTKKVSELGNDINSIVYSMNLLNNFCSRNYIQLYYYEPRTHSFYIKEKNSFIATKLDLFKEIKIKMPLIFSLSSLEIAFKENESLSTTINIEYKKYLNKKRNKPSSFTYKYNDFNFGILFDFAKDYFENVNIISFIDLHETHLDCQYLNYLTIKQAMIFLKLIKKNEYEVDSLIYNNHLFKKDNNELKLKNIIKLGRYNDFMVIIGFSSILDTLKMLFLK